jgi:hypothetical protein
MSSTNINIVLVLICTVLVLVGLFTVRTDVIMDGSGTKTWRNHQGVLSGDELRRPIFATSSTTPPDDTNKRVEVKIRFNNFLFPFTREKKN